MRGILFPLTAALLLLLLLLLLPLLTIIIYIVNIHTRYTFRSN
jgi:hypothetical protein